MSLGKRIVTACGDNTLIYWDPRSPTPLFKLTAQDARFDLGGITSLAINPASTIAVVGGTEGGVRVVSLSKGEVISALGGHTAGESVEAIIFVNIIGATDGSSASVGSAGAGTVITGATDGKVCIWDLNTSRLRTTLEHKVSFPVVFRLPLRCLPVYFAFPRLIKRYWSAGCRYQPVGAPDKTTLCHLVICRSYPSDMGCACWHPHSGAQRPPRANQWCCTGTRWRYCHQYQ